MSPYIIINDYNFVTKEIWTWFKHQVIPLSKNFNLIPHLYRLTGLAESVRLLRFWQDQFFHQGKSKIPFLQNASNKQSASVILGLIKAYYIKIEKAYQEVQDYRPPTHPVHCFAHKVLCCAKA